MEKQKAILGYRILDFKTILSRFHYLIPIFSPLVFSTIFHLGFAKIQNGNDYGGLVLYLSILTVISTILLLGKELQYYQNVNTKELIKSDLFTLFITSITISLLVYFIYAVGNIKVNFNSIFILFTPLKVVLDYLIIILNVVNEAKFVRYSFDILFSLIQVTCLVFYFLGLLNLDQMFIVFLVYFFLMVVLYSKKLRLNELHIIKKYDIRYFTVSKALISGLGSFVSRFQFIIMSLVSPEVIGIANIAFTISNSLTIPYNYLTKLNLPLVLNKKDSFFDRFNSVRKYSLIYAMLILVSCIIFIFFNPIKLEYFDEKSFLSYLLLYILASLVDVFVGLKSSFVQIVGNEKNILANLILVLIITFIVPFIFTNAYQGILFYIVFVILSNILFHYKFKPCYENYR